MSRYCGLVVCLLLVLSPKSVAAQQKAADKVKLTYEKHIRPILRTHCFDCHGGGEELKGGLDLRLRRLMLKGGESGAAIVSGKPKESLLIERVREGEMPPGDTRVSDKELAILEQWITAGAKTARPEPETIGKGVGITAEDRAFWSFQPIRRPQIPKFKTTDRVRTPVDALLLEQMQPRGLSFSPDAGKQTLMLRAYFDLIGLPPTPKQAEKFFSDKRPQAYERLIDELLDSPYYGERWGRHWLDIAGYADSEGYTNADTVRPYAYKYRDYVIRSFNADKPFDRFIVEQLAGDELVKPPYANLTAEQIELLTATGFLRMAADGTGSGANNADGRNQVITDTLKIVSTSLLGMTVACAQCHDHRYDPIPQQDYYQLRAVFAPAYDWQNWRTPTQRRVSLYTDADRKQAGEVEAEAGKIAAEKSKKQAEYMTAALDKELSKYEEPLRQQLRDAYQTPGGKRTAEQKALLKKNPSVNIRPGVLYQYNQKAADDLKKYDARMAEVRKKKPVEEFIRVLTEVPGKISATRLFHRGDHRQPKDTVSPAGLSVTTPAGERFSIAVNNAETASAGRRLAYARWLTSGKHPLVGRVLVNQIWLHHFGRGIVGTPADFGRLGEKPSHPKLLDWLADDFARQGWSLKKLHKTIMLSTAYRQSSIADAAKTAIDPDNQFYWRKPVQRLDAEIVRDRILATSSALDLRQFGPSVPVKEDDTGQVVVAENQFRRSVYVQVRRSQPVALLRAFDAPVMETNCEKRPSSTVATQSLMLMNGDFMLKQAARFAQRVKQESPADIDPQMTAGLTVPASAQSVWRFGYGGFSDQTKRVRTFAKLPHWTGSNWQGSAQRPDAKIGWVGLNAAGGHPGDNPDFAAIRRWVAPRDGILVIGGKLKHTNPKGDGVRGRIVSSRYGIFGEWIAQNKETPTSVERLTVRKGDTVDFITDCRVDTGFDSFQWPVQLKLTADKKPVGEWNSAAEFTGPQGPPIIAQVAYAWHLAYNQPPTRDDLTVSLGFVTKQLAYLRALPADKSTKTTPEQRAMTNFCQALLSSNQFLYVD